MEGRDTDYLLQCYENARHEIRDVLPAVTVWRNHTLVQLAYYIHVLSEGVHY